MNNDKMKQPRETVYYWTKGTAGGFMTALIDLFGKADMENSIRLSMGFPLIAEALRELSFCKDEEDFKEKYNLFVDKQN